MTLKGYTDADTVAAQLGRTLTVQQTTHLTTVVLPAVEEWIDLNGGRSYGEGAVTAEQLYAVNGPYVWLRKVPVTQLTAVRGYFYGQSANDMFTLASSEYTLTDPTDGAVTIYNWRSYAYLEADYTPDNVIPGRIKLAAAIVAGVFMRTVIHPQTDWLTEYASAQDVRVKFRDLTIPENVFTLMQVDTSSIIVA